MGMHVNRRDLLRGMVVLGTGAALPGRTLWADQASAAEPRRIDIHHHDVPPEWLGDPSFEPVWAELDRHKAVVYAHATVPSCCRGISMPPIDKNAKGLDAPDEETGIELNTDTARTIISLIESGTAAKYPNIRFIFSHAGGTMPALAGRYIRAQATSKILAAPATPDSRLDHLRRFYYDTAGSANPVQLNALKMIVPTSQIMFGTDFPWGTPKAIAEGLAGCGFSEAEMQGIDRDNALRLLPQYRT